MVLLSKWTAASSWSRASRTVTARTASSGTANSGASSPGTATSRTPASRATRPGESCPGSQPGIAGPCITTLVFTAVFTHRTILAATCIHKCTAEACYNHLVPEILRRSCVVVVVVHIQRAGTNVPIAIRAVCDHGSEDGHRQHVGPAPASQEHQ
ncbi:hypothetical protein ColKHC_09452 [Colletotrichum higginsianum]|nr:hypothetical protein ColKHC_09452 [Colletotrichum higginsianum]